MQEHVAHIERRNKELLFEHDLLKRELDSARLHTYHIQSHSSLQTQYQGTVKAACVQYKESRNFAPNFAAAHSRL